MNTCRYFACRARSVLWAGAAVLCLATLAPCPEDKRPTPDPKLAHGLRLTLEVLSDLAPGETTVDLMLALHNDSDSVALVSPALGDACYFHIEALTGPHLDGPILYAQPRDSYRYTPQTQDLFRLQPGRALRRHLTVHLPVELRGVEDVELLAILNCGAEGQKVEGAWDGLVHSNPATARRCRGPDDCHRNGRTPGKSGLVISGTAVYPDGKPCGGCAVHILGEGDLPYVEPGETRDDGTFTVPGIVPGEYTVWAENPAGEGGYLVELMPQVTVRKWRDVHGLELPVPTPSGRKPSVPIILSCKEEGFCRLGPCNPSLLPCCKPFVLDPPESVPVGMFVPVEFTASPSGRVTNVTLLTSSGDREFDIALIDKYKENTCFAPEEFPVVVTGTIRVR